MSCKCNSIVKQAENLKNAKGRIDIIELANSLGLKVYTTAEISVPSFIAYDKENKCYEIFVNSKEKVTRQRFSVAHEIAHFIEHKDKIMEFGIVGRQNDYSLSAKEEAQADTLAANILMPENCLDEYLKNENIGLDTKIDLNIVQKIARTFEVSLISVIMRLRGLGYYVKYIELY